MAGRLALTHLALRSATHESTERAAALLRTLINWFAEQRNLLFLHIAIAITGTGAWAARCGRAADAARILGFLDRHDPGGWQTIADVRDGLNVYVAGRTDPGPWLAEGAAMTRDQMVAFCLDLLKEGSGHQAV